jgi:hypothetical protein
MRNLLEAETTPVITEAVAELIALGAALAANNPDAFQQHNERLQELGVSRAERIRAANLAIQVKMAPHREIMALAEDCLSDPAGGGCGGNCGGECECDGEGEGCGTEGCGCGH